MVARDCEDSLSALVSMASFSVRGHVNLCACCVLLELSSLLVCVLLCVSMCLMWADQFIPCGKCSVLILLEFCSEARWTVVLRYYGARGCGPRCCTGCSLFESQCPFVRGFADLRENVRGTGVLLLGSVWMSRRSPAVKADCVQYGVRRCCHVVVRRAQAGIEFCGSFALFFAL